MTPGQKRRATIDDVAAAANVSRGTVSRVLGGGHWVSPKSEAAVREAMLAVDYHPSSAAQRLANSKAHAIALLITEPDDLTFAGTGFTEMTRVISDELGKQGTSLLLHRALSPVESKLAVDFVRSGSVDGVLLLSVYDGQRQLIKDLARSGCPLVCFGTPPQVRGVRLGYVTSDNEGGAFDAVEHLQAAGRSRIVMLAGPNDHSTARERLAGYRRALGSAFDPDLVLECGYSTSAGHDAMARWLAGGPTPDAVFAVNDAAAVGAVQALRSAGLTVPKDVAVVGFDDSPQARQSDPPLTTVHQPMDQIAQAMVAAILDARNDGEPARITVPTHLVVRSTT